jgi:hypothetical protein
VNKTHLKNQSPAFLLISWTYITLQAIVFVADSWLGGSATVATRMLAENSGKAAENW